MKDTPLFSILPIVPILLVDASLAGVQVAVVDAAPRTAGANAVPGADRLLWHGAHRDNMGALSAISDLTQTGLKACSLRVRDLVGVAVASGPGSFTGIKIGMAFVAGLRSSAERAMPVLAVSALDAAAGALALASGQPTAVFLPATRTHGFVALAGGPHASTTATLVDCEQTAPALFQRLPKGCSVHVAGSWPLLTAEAEKANFAVQSMTLADLSALALPAMASLCASAWPAAYQTELPEPRYQRLSTAEERLLATPTANQQDKQELS